jgi:UDP-N-acetylglucosamine 2-epimerase
MKVAVVFGTRPEAIKMAPVVHALRRAAAAGASLQAAVYVTAQHRDMLDQVLNLFGIEPDADLDAMRPDQGLADLTARMLTQLDELFRRESPELVLVHGDTTTAFVAALAAYYQKIPVGHVEAGLRTRNRYSPFPEELNRQMVDSLATYHFAPTSQAVDNLLAEKIAPDGVVQTGNTVIDALLIALERIGTKAPAKLLGRYPSLSKVLNGQRRMLLVTSHRRENFGHGMTGIFEALVELTVRFPDTEVVYPVHPNPQVREATKRLLAGRERIHLLDPLDYDDFCYLMSRCHLILTDSGGIQEEAPTLNKPVLVLRDTSERPEAVAAGAARVVGTQRQTIVEAATTLLTNAREYQTMADAVNPYGDGHAADKIVDFLRTVGQRKAD